MKRSITIEIDDRAPTFEYCGESCKFLKSGVCLLFDVQLESDALNKADEQNGTVVYEKTQKILGWHRHKKCITVFYSFSD